MCNHGEYFLVIYYYSKYLVKFINRGADCSEHIIGDTTNFKDSIQDLSVIYFDDELPNVKGT